MTSTRVFVSSTCYDLIYMRENLRKDLTSLGHVPVMSDFLTFSVDPDLTPLENCRRNVIENADVFILVVGGRYGSIDPASGKSIVNLEYEAAVAEGLDIIVFVDQAVLALLPIYEKNPNADLSPAVQTNLVLDFIQGVRASQKWTFPFSKESDISEIVSTQLSSRFRDLLSRKRSGKLNELYRFRTEDKKSRSLVSERPPYWEYALLSRLVRTRLVSIKKLYEDLMNQRVLGAHKTLNEHEYVTWMGDKFQEFLCAVNKLKHVLDVECMLALGPPGVSGDPLHLLDAANAIQRVMDALIEIESDIFRTHGPQHTLPLREAALGMTEEIFQQVATLPDRLDAVVATAGASNPKQEPRVVSIALVLTFSRAEQFKDAFASVLSQRPGPNY